jgi:glycosyltransferase involved in cell wall biosynthesis
MAPNHPPGASVDFSSWIESRALEPAELDLQRRLIQEFSERPLVSIITPVYRIEAAVLDDTIRSVVHQTYENWELCLAVGDDSDPERSRLLRDWEATDQRIKIRKIENSGIARNSNEALALARGEWAVLLDHDDLLTPDALFHLVRAGLADPDAALVYSDKDQVGADGSTRQHPLLKCAWAPDIMLNTNYLTHLNMMRVDRLREIGGWDPDTDGAQDWDLFLRVIGTAGRVVHVPRILYHWRQVQTSVASGGLSAKPYAAAAQLRAVSKHLQTAGWAGGSARFEGPMVRVNWPPDWRPFVSLLVCGNGEAAAMPQGMPQYDWAGQIEVLAAPGAITGVKGVSGAKGDAASVLDALVASARGDVLVVWDAGLAVRSPDWLAELVGPLANPAIAAVAGAVYRPDETIDAMGAFSIDGEIRPGFHGLRYLEGGPFGNSAWYGNASATPLRLCALRRSDWRSLQDHRESGRADLSFTLDLARERGRILLNPFATATAQRPDPFVVTDPEALRSRITETLPNADPFVSPHLTFAETGWLTFRMPRHVSSADHSFASEARYTAEAYDATAENVKQSVLACATAPVGPLTSLCWIVPPFEVPFYGGIYTILRSAEFMRVQHGVRPLFAVLGATPGKGTPEAVRATIARAFPTLAKAAQIEVLADGDDVPSFGPVDAMICTLWITAFPMLKARNVQRKFYFLQDWEPLFYPAGTISGLVEATYRFGFHAICNTPSLAESYRALGGTAEHFLPAIDAAVFHPRVGDRPEGAPFRLFCYGRPGTPRNGFETLAVALQELKRRWGDSIDIITAGADWQPEAHGLGGVVRHLGLLPYADTGALYRACDAGLVAMATRHPSYLPFEFMASGAAVVTNRNPYTSWLLRDGKNAALCEMTRGDIVRAVEAVMTDDALRSRIVQGGYETIRADHSDWSATCETIYGILDRTCRTKPA